LVEVTNTRLNDSSVVEVVLVVVVGGAVDVVELGSVVVVVAGSDVLVVVLGGSVVVVVPEHGHASVAPLTAVATRKQASASVDATLMLPSASHMHSGEQVSSPTLARKT
jgi:hypothetical protein